MKTLPQKDSKKIEKAIVFLTQEFQKGNLNKKPSLFHSVRVGISLFNYGFGKDVIISGLLHDILEDTKCSNKKLKDKFSNEVYKLVTALTFDKNIKDPKERWGTQIKKIKQAGRKAMIIKVADALDNLPYYFLPEIPKAIQKSSIWKHKMIIDNFKGTLSKEKIFQDYKKNFKEYSE